MKIKTGVNISMLSKEVKKAYPAIEEVCGIYKIDFVITAGSDGTHMAGSKHYSLPFCEAIDFRSRDLSDDDKLEFLYSLKGRLEDEFPGEFDALFEGNHYHLEWDPK